MFGEPAFRLDGCLAAQAGGGDGLAIDVVGAVARDINAGNVGLHLGTGDGLDVAALVHCDRGRERAGVWHMADGDKDALDGQHGLGAGLDVFHLEAADGALFHAEHLDGDAVPDHLDFFVGDGAVRHDLGCAQRITAVDKINFAGEAREEEGLFGCAVAAAEHGDLHLAVECAVARRAGGHALAAVEFFFARDAGHARRRAGGDDDGLCKDDAIAEEKLAGLAREIDRGDESLFEACAEAGGLLAHVLGELETVDAVREAGEVFHFARRGELAAGERAFEDKRVEIGAGGVNGGGEAGASGAYDDDVFDGGGHGEKRRRVF